MMALLAGIAYVAIGRFFPNPATNQFWWRLGAWILSAIIFAIHVAIEYRRGGPAWRVARNAAIGTAIGGFGLAAWAMVYNGMRGTAHPGTWGLALVLWPVITAVPGFILAYLSATLLQRFSRQP